MNRDRLQHLVTILEKVDPSRFDMQSWACGTAACAIGHAACDPDFNTQGLHLIGNTLNTRYFPVYGEHEAWSAVRRFFHLSLEDSELLFSQYAYPRSVTVNDVINRIKEFIQ